MLLEGSISASHVVAALLQLTIRKWTPLSHALSRLHTEAQAPVAERTESSKPTSESEKTLAKM